LRKIRLGIDFFVAPLEKIDGRGEPPARIIDAFALKRAEAI
jgi:hypothetical protein